MGVAIDIGIYAGTAAFFGIAFLLPLYFSQARDVRRLRTWMALAPDLSQAEREAAEAAKMSEAAAAPAPAAVAAPAAPAAPPPAAPPTPEPRPVPGLGPEEGPPAPAAPPPAPTPPSGPPPPAPTPTPSRGTTPVRPLSPAERIALDRPATARLTAERVAVAPPPSRFSRLGRLGTGRGLAVLVGAVLALGIAVVFVSLQLSDEGQEGRERSSAIVPSEIEVAVLNGTAEPGLAGKVGDDLEGEGFGVGNVTNSESPFDDTVVMFTPGNEREGEAVARYLGVTRVVPMDAATRAEAGEAGVAVIAGEDRAGGA